MLLSYGLLAQQTKHTGRGGHNREPFVQVSDYEGGDSHPFADLKPVILLLYRKRA